MKPTFRFLSTIGILLIALQLFSCKKDDNLASNAESGIEVAVSKRGQVKIPTLTGSFVNHGTTQLVDNDNLPFLLLSGRDVSSVEFIPFSEEMVDTNEVIKRDFFKNSGIDFGEIWGIHFYKSDSIFIGIKQNRRKASEGALGPSYMSFYLGNIDSDSLQFLFSDSGFVDGPYSGAGPKRMQSLHIGVNANIAFRYPYLYIPLRPNDFPYDVPEGYSKKLIRKVNIATPGTASDLIWEYPSEISNFELDDGPMFPGQHIHYCYQWKDFYFVSFRSIPQIRVYDLSSDSLVHTIDQKCSRGGPTGPISEYDAAKINCTPYNEVTCLGKYFGIQAFESNGRTFVLRQVFLPAQKEPGPDATNTESEFVFQVFEFVGNKLYFKRETQSFSSEFFKPDFFCFGEKLFLRDKIEPSYSGTWDNGDIQPANERLKFTSYTLNVSEL